MASAAGVLQSKLTKSMYLWRRSATHDWTNRHEQKLRQIAGNQLAIIDRPNRKRLQIEVASDQRTYLVELAEQFGGQIQKLPRDWLKRSLRHKTKPIKVGNKWLTIPAGAAFGTGEHATTAMCLRMLEKLFCDCGAHGAECLPSPNLVIDLGTGSGVFALAAKILGAKRVIGLDNDPMAISTANQNAKLNKIRNVRFRMADVRRWQFPREIDVVTANLFSELLIEILPALRAARWLILSGILRNQEPGVRRAVTRANHEIIEVRRRGKWVAMLAARR
jgi:ribosomal protein L11 methyltransferase